MFCPSHSLTTLSSVATQFCIWVRSWNCSCLVTWFCYQLIAKPGNKTAAVQWPDPYLCTWFIFGTVIDTTMNMKALESLGPQQVKFQGLKQILEGRSIETNYHQTSNTGCTLVGNKIVDHSDVVGASPVGAAPATSVHLHSWINTRL